MAENHKGIKRHFKGPDGKPFTFEDWDEAEAFVETLLDVTVWWVDSTEPYDPRGKFTQSWEHIHKVKGPDDKS